MSKAKQEENLNSALQKAITQCLTKILKHSCQHLPKEILCEFLNFAESVFF